MPHHERRTLATARVAVTKGYSATERGGVPLQRVMAFSFHLLVAG